MELLTALVTEVRSLRRELRTSRREVLSAAQAASLLGIDRGRLGRLIKAGLVPAARDGRGFRILRADVERLAAGGIPPEPGRVGRPRKQLPVRCGDAIRKLPLS